METPTATIAFPPALAESVLACALREAGIVAQIEAAVQTRLSETGLLDKVQAAKFLSIEMRTLEVWMRPGGDRGGRGVPHLKIGEAVRFKVASLEAWAGQYEINRLLPRVA